MYGLAEIKPELSNWIEGKATNQLLQRAIKESTGTRQSDTLYLCDLIQRMESDMNDPIRIRATLLQAWLTGKMNMVMQALERYDEAIKLAQKALGKDHPVVAEALIDKADLLIRQPGKLKAKYRNQAISAINQAIKSITNFHEASDYRLVRAHHLLFRIQNEASEKEAARQALRDAADLCAASCGCDDPEYAMLLREEAGDFPNAYEFADLKQRIEQAMEIFAACFGAQDYEVSDCWWTYSRLLRANNMPEEADRAYTKSKELNSQPAAPSTGLLIADLNNAAGSSKTLAQKLREWRDQNGMGQFVYR